MRKIFISFLGTNDYVPVTYQFDGKDATDHPTVFVQEALINSICRGWTKNDVIAIFRTEKSEMLNWKDREISGEPGVVRKGLCSTLNGMDILKKQNVTINPGEYSDYIIPPGFDNDEIWRIFDAVDSKIEADDEIYFDITHAFRTIPMFATVLFNYCRFMKDTEVQGVYYGAFEKLGSIRDVLDMDVDRRRVPIIDMTNLVNLQKINFAAANFSQYGSLATGVQMDITGDLYAETALKRLKKALNRLELYMQTCRIQDIRKGSYMSELSACIEDLRKSSLNKAQINLIEEMLTSLKDFGFTDDSTYRNVEAAVSWLSYYGNIQQALTLAREYFPHRIADYYIVNGLNRELGFNEMYTVADSALKLSRDTINRNEKLKGKAAELAKGMYNLPYWDRVKKAFYPIRELRNGINHANSAHSSIASFSEAIDALWETAVNALNSSLGSDE